MRQAGTWKPRGYERVDGTHRFDYDRDDVRNNERGRGQERGCDLTSTSQLNFVIITVHNVHLYVYVACPYLYCLYVESVRCLPFVWASGSLEMACSRLSDNEHHEYPSPLGSRVFRQSGVARVERNCNPVVFGDVFSGRCAPEMHACVAIDFNKVTYLFNTRGDFAPTLLAGRANADHVVIYSPCGN